MEAPCSRFTAAEGGARLAATASTKNTLSVEYASFISTRMIYEDAYKIRGSLYDGKQRSIYVTRASRVDVVAYELNILTDLKITKAVKYEDVFDWWAELDKKEVVVCTSSVIHQVLQEELLTMSNINVLVLDSCHLICQDDSLKYIMKLYKESKEGSRPRILALTYPLFSYPKKESLKGKLEENLSKSNENLSNVKETEENSDEISENLPLDSHDTEKLPKTEETTKTTEEKLPETEKATKTAEEKLPKTEKATLKTTEENLLETGEISAATTDEKLSEFELTTESQEAKEKFEKTLDIDSIGVYENFDDFEMYEKLEWKIEQLEEELCCQMDLAEDIDGGKRLSATITKPKEVIIEHAGLPDLQSLPAQYKDLDHYMRQTVAEAVAFLDEHRYDPSEIYGEDLYEEFMNIPNPTIEPRQIFRQFLYVLDQLGPYAADKAAFSLLTKLEKLKIKVPYERHFLLLCLCTTVFIKIRCYADLVFSKFDSDWAKIKTFCTPKVLRFAEILEKFSPPGLANENHNKPIENKTSNKMNEMLNAIERCDFVSLGNNIEDKVNTYEANLKDLDSDNRIKTGESETNTDNASKDLEITREKLVNITNVPDTIENDPNSTDIESYNKGNEKEGNEGTKKGNESNKTETDHNVPSVPQSPQKCYQDQKTALGFPKRQGHRVRGRGRSQRSNQARTQQTQQNPDALCGIVFMKEPLVAKIMFMLIVDMSRSNPKLSYICSQYCAVESPADPGTEPRECQRQGKKQEDVLKKFRMHECNLLLATSALEEGIDLPRCNLVLRWDMPASYRSYGLCRSRARAPRATCALLSRAHAQDTSTLLHNVAVYTELDQIISRKCGCGVQNEPPQSEEDHADAFTNLVKAYTPNGAEITTAKSNNNKQYNNEVLTQKITNLTTPHSDNNELTTESKNDDNENCESDIKTIIPNCNSAEYDNNFCDKCNVVRSDSSDLCVCVFSDKNVDFNKDNKKSEKKCDDSIASVDLSTAIALINRYCGKLPSDTFTRLAPQWWIEEVQLPVRGSDKTSSAYICTLRLPLNCPVKHNIVGHPMPTKALARRMVALQACRILHKTGELDHQLMPIGKENFKAAELDNTGNFDLDPNDSARPGTTKRRQYYFKRTAWAFTDCQPVVDTSDAEMEKTEDGVTKENEVTKEVPAETVQRPVKKRNMLYAIVSSLWCALPERYNTRGRRLHAPQSASQAIGILMAREEPDSLQIPAFPVYTRSGEVRVSAEYVPDADVRMSPRRGRLVRRFMRFVFAEVLRVRRRGMRLQSDGSTHNNYYIVPTVKTTRADGSTKIDIDWSFLELIYHHTEEKKNSEVERPNLWQNEEESEQQRSSQVKEKDKKSGEVKKMANPLLKEGETFVFDADKYREAVVTPWYRNQDQPQFFLVAEICWNLSPDSAFPSALHTTFRQYYLVKYGVTLTQTEQPLLDVDHTSNRLNLLTPRYVNRKGVALPVSSERTRRAKRDRLDQKQILVPELCRVHPFAAPLWFATVALPCVLYRINALLIADEIRRSVAIDVGLGIPKIDEKTCPGFQWPPLDFGWSLAEVLNADSEKSEKKTEEDDSTRKVDKMKDLEEDSDTQKEVENTTQEEKRQKTINDILQEKECTENAFEIGTWSNDMASSIPHEEEYDEYMEPLPPNLTFCTSASGGSNWCDPVEKPKSQFQPSNKYNMADSDCSYMSSDFDTDDSDLNSEASTEDDTSGFCSSKNSNVTMGVRIEYKTAHEAEAIDLERRKVNPAPLPDEADDATDRANHEQFARNGQAPAEYIEKFRASVAEHEKQIVQNGFLIKHDEPIVEILPEPTKESLSKLPRHILEDVKLDKQNIERIHLDIEMDNNKLEKFDIKNDIIKEIFPYGNTDLKLLDENGQISLENIEKNKRLLLAELKNSLAKEEVKKLNCFSMVDVDIDSSSYVNEKIVNVGFDKVESYQEKIEKWRSPEEYKPYFLESKSQGKDFDFDYQPNLEGHPGPSPSVILQALTMSNANDGINLERLETIGDSFLKFAITAYLYCAHPTVHEGKLSHMRSKQVSNLNLYRLGRNKRLGARMIASKFEPHDNWLPPCHKPPSALHATPHHNEDNSLANQESNNPLDNSNSGCFIPYNLITQHSIPDKSIADCVEALIGAYLLECGPRGALLFMSWLGIRVLPKHDVALTADHPYVRQSAKTDRLQQEPPPRVAQPRRAPAESDSETDSSDDEEVTSTASQVMGPEPDWSWRGRPVGSLRPYRDDSGQWYQTIFGELKAPPSPLLRYIEDPEGELEQMLSGYDALERTLQYRFKDRSLLLQALTHASHQQNRLTDCYQRLEFLGDAILDYLITRHLYEDPRRHSPGALTDLRSALVNNTIFACLAARHGFHKYFRHMSCGLSEVLARYVRVQDESNHSIGEEHYLIQEDALEQAEDVEVPKALGDLFESVAGAIFLDSGMSLGAVWKSYVNLMGAELEAFSAAAPKSPVRELLEAEPDTAKFGKPERLADGRRVRVCVEVFGRGAFKGVGRNYRIAKGTAARCALRHLKIHRQR